MDIKNVNLNEAQSSFTVTFENDSKVFIPNDPANANYWEVKAWYDAQETKPFEFDFEELGEPEFAETIYPPEPEELEEQVDSEEPAPPDEPETLLPR